MDRPVREPGVWTRLRIRASGQIPNDELQAYRTASLEVWTLVESIAERRLTGEVAPVENLSGWIVFSLQTFGNALMDADDFVDPVTAGYVPPATHGVILNLYREVSPWLLRAYEGRSDPGLELRRKTPLPLPQTPADLVSSIVGVNALLVTVRAMRDELPHVAKDPPADVVGRIEAALAAARYAEGLVPPGTVLFPNDLHRLGRPLRKAAGELFKAGQLAALPTLSAPRR